MVVVHPGHENHEAESQISHHCCKKNTLPHKMIVGGTLPISHLASASVKVCRREGGFLRKQGKWKNPLWQWPGEAPPNSQVHQQLAQVPSVARGGAGYQTEAIGIGRDGVQLCPMVLHCH